VSSYAPDQIVARLPVGLSPASYLLAVYRAPSYTPVFDTGYYYQFLPFSGNNGMAMDLTGGWTTNGTLMNQFTYDTNRDNQKSGELRSGTRMYRAPLGR